MFKEIKIKKVNNGYFVTVGKIGFNPLYEECVFNTLQEVKEFLDQYFKN